MKIIRRSIGCSRSSEGFASRQLGSISFFISRLGGTCFVATGGATAGVLFATTCKRTVWCMALLRVEGRVFELPTTVDFERSIKPISALAGELALPLPVEVHRLELVFLPPADSQQLSFFFARSRASYKKRSRAAREEC